MNLNPPKTPNLACSPGQVLATRAELQRDDWPVDDDVVPWQGFKPRTRGHAFGGVRRSQIECCRGSELGLLCPKCALSRKALSL